MNEQNEKTQTNEAAIDNLDSIIKTARRLKRQIKSGKVELHPSHEKELERVEEKFYDFVQDLTGG